MKTLVQVAAELQGFVRRQGWGYCFIGGLALQRWGVPRLTRDVDLTVLADYGQEEPKIRALLEHWAGRLPDAAAFARANRVLLLRSAEGVGIDLVFGALPFEAEAVARASDFAFLPGVELRTCSAEDLIVMKAFADRTRDWADVEAVIARQGAALDAGYIIGQLRPLAEIKGIPEAVDRLRRLLEG